MHEMDFVLSLEIAAISESPEDVCKYLKRGLNNFSSQAYLLSNIKNRKKRKKRNLLSKLLAGIERYSDG